ncbi:hypothetical protein TWF694_011439 [Orbilia ellipsospora]|uniref:DUF2828 domain-containing protein n=1 Tax=Orbilia ellipsospora TaxID=2528407 RepID=A0AAV9X582_9PEZI
MHPTPASLLFSQLFRRLWFNNITRYFNRSKMNPNNNLHLTSQIVTLPHLPELYNPRYLDILLPPRVSSQASASSTKDAASVPSNPMMSALEDTANRTRTENMAPAYRSTGDALLDAFHRPTASDSPEVINRYLAPAWEKDPETALRIIFYLRSIHDGKNDKSLFYRAWYWLYTHHPRTAIYNLKELVALNCHRKSKPKRGEQEQRVLPGMSHGYWKDLLNILCLATTTRLGTSDHFNLGNGVRLKSYQGVYSRKSRQAERYEKLCLLLEGDKKYRALYIAVARLFAEQLEKDNEIASKIEVTKDKKERSLLEWQLSLAGKWAPTPGCAHDRITNISTAISQLLHANRQAYTLDYPSSLAAYDHLAPLMANQATVIRSFFQRWVLSPLRAAAKVPEPLMASKRWGEIVYNRVPAVCMQQNSERFYRHDHDRFAKYMHDVMVGKKTISGATLLPHEIIMRLLEYDADTLGLRPQQNEMDKVKVDFYKSQANVAISQWKALVDRLKESGNIDNAIAVCDVSGSMGYLNDFGNRKKPQPIFPAIAMSMLLATLAKPPFNSGFITFSATPEFLKIKDLNDLVATVRDMADAPWGMNTDLQAVFTKLLLPLAKQNNVKKEDMIKRLFVFSDMQFDEAADSEIGDRWNTNYGDRWNTNYDLIKKEYEDAGYDVPEIVFWDLGKFDTVEADSERKGVAMMKGFSGSMMKVFLGDEEEDEDIVMVDGEDKEDGDMVVVCEATEEDKRMTPIKIMRKAVMRKSFDGLKVLEDGDFYSAGLEWRSRSDLGSQKRPRKPWTRQGQ